MIATLIPFLSQSGGLPKLKTFGTGRSAFRTGPTEQSLFSYTVSPGADSGVMTHFWTTGDTDRAVFRYYVDGEATPSIEFTAPAAAGAPFGDAAMWGNAANGKGGSVGGWYVNYKVTCRPHRRPLAPVRLSCGRSRPRRHRRSSSARRST